MSKTTIKWLAFIVIIILMIYVVACDSQKHITTTDRSKDSTYIDKLERESQAKDKEIERLNNKISELEYFGIAFNNRPPATIDLDSLKRVLTAGGCKQSDIDKLSAQVEALNQDLIASKAEVKFYKDGSVEVKGRLDNVTRSKLVVEETLKETVRERDELVKEKQELEGRLQEAESSKAKDVERKAWGGFPWVMLVIGLIIGGGLVWRFKR